MLGAAGSWYLIANGQPVTDIANGGYYDFVVNPGKVEFKTTSDVSLINYPLSLASHLSGEYPICILQAEPNNTYYFKFEIGDKMGPVSKDEAIRAMTGMHRFDDPSPPQKQ